MYHNYENICILEILYSLFTRGVSLKLEIQLTLVLSNSKYLATLLRTNFRIIQLRNLKINICVTRLFLIRLVLVLVLVFVFVFLVKRLFIYVNSFNCLWCVDHFACIFAVAQLSIIIACSLERNSDGISGVSGPRKCPQVNPLYIHRSYPHTPTQIHSNNCINLRAETIYICLV